MNSGFVCSLLKNFVLIFDLGMVWTRPDILRVVLGPYVQYWPCEASEQKLGQKPKSEINEI